MVPPAILPDLVLNRDYRAMLEIRVRRLLALSFVLGCHALTAAAAEPGDPFYKGKTLSLVVFTSPGGAYDTYSRLLSRHLPRHIEGQPTIVVRNMPGAGGVTAARYLAESAPRDGTVMASLSRTLIYDPLLSKNGVKIDYPRFGWLGSMAQSTAVYISWANAKVKKVEDLYTHELLIADTGAASETNVVSSVLNGVLGMKLKLINGYEGSAAALKALEAGEIDGSFPTMEALQTTRPDWIRDKKINILFQTRQKPDLNLPGVPTANSLAKSDTQRQALDFMFPRDVIGRPFAMPPGVAPARLTQLQEAFAAALRDGELVAEAEKMRIPLELTTGGDLAQVIGDAYATPDAIVAHVRQFVGIE